VASRAKPWIVPIPGTRRIDHLEENLGAIDVPLSVEDVRVINDELSKLTVHGLRMDEDNMKIVED
jgi:aryl-alcohol dehydrogenase-like predicted oxidoreductase